MAMFNSYVSLPEGKHPYITIYFPDFPINHHIFSIYIYIFPINHDFSWLVWLKVSPDLPSAEFTGRPESRRHRWGDPAVIFPPRGTESSTVMDFPWKMMGKCWKIHGKWWIFSMGKCWKMLEFNISWLVNLTSVVLPNFVGAVHKKH